MLARIRSLLRATALFVVPTVLACTVVLELGLRAMGRLPSNTTDGIFEKSAEGYRLRRLMTKVSRTPSFSCTIHTNDLGLRDREPRPRALGSRPYFAFLGDSLTFGNGVDYDDSFVGFFAALARERGRDALNLAVGGHRLTDQEELLSELLATAPQRPSHVVVVFTALLVAGFEERHADIIVKNGYLFRKDAWVVPYATVLLGNSSSAYTFLRDGIRKVEARFRESTALRGALDLLEAFSRRAPLADPATAARLEARLSRLDQTIRAAGATPIYVYLPSSADLRSREFLALTGRHPEEYDFQLHLRLLERHCEKSGVKLVNLLPVLEREHAKGRPLSFMQDMHYDVGANHVIGRALQEALLDGAVTTTSVR